MRKHGTKLMMFLGGAAVSLLLLVASAQCAHASPPPGGGTGSSPAATGAKEAERKPPAADKSAAGVGDGTVNVNTAGEDELMRLPGVGPTRAAAVVAYRKKHGPFGKIDDVGRVKGFGRKTLVRLKTNLSVSGATTYDGKKRSSRPAPVVAPPPPSS